LVLGAAGSASADVSISSDATANMSCASGVCQPTASDAVLNVGDLENLLAAGNVTVTTTGSGIQADNIDVAAKLGWSANALTLDAYQSLSVTAPVTVRGASGLSILTNDGGSGGELAFFGNGHDVQETLRRPVDQRRELHAGKHHRRARFGGQERPRRKLCPRSGLRCEQGRGVWFVPNPVGYARRS
jgi:hypothetical protein